MAKKDENGAVQCAWTYASEQCHNAVRAVFHYVWFWRMTMFLRTLVATAISAAPSIAHAESSSLQAAIGNPANLHVSATIRLRYEALSGQPRAGLNPDDEQLAIRSTLSAEWHRGAITMGAEINDSRAYLGKAGSSISANDVNTFEPVQAYVAAAISKPFGEGSLLTIKGGRFTFNLGSRRFVSSDDYRNATAAYAGLRADLKLAGGTNATVFYTLPVQHRPDDLASILVNRAALDKEDFSLRLWGAVVVRPKSFGPATPELGFYRLQERDTPARATRDRNLVTISARVFRDPKLGQWDYELELAHQFGSISASSLATAAKLDVSANLVHASLGYSLPGKARARLSIAYDYVSGDGPDAAYGRFDTLYGSRRGEFAPAGILSDIGRANIAGPVVRLELAPGKRLDAMVNWRAMWLASRTDSFSTSGVRDQSGVSGDFAGHLIDARVRYWLLPDVLRGELNASWIGKGQFLRQAPNAPATGDTRYFSATLSASF